MAVGDIGDALTDYLTYIADVVSVPRVCHAIGDIYALTYTHSGDSDGYLSTISISSAGAIPDAVLGTLEFDTDRGVDISSIKVADGVVAVAYRGTDEDGFVKTIGIVKYRVVG